MGLGGLESPNDRARVCYMKSRDQVGDAMAALYLPACYEGNIEA